jgi:Big-like domain-containing protein
VTAQVTSPAGKPGGSVVFSADGIVVATVPVAADGTATAQVGPFDSVGTHQVTAGYTGDDSTSGSEASADVTVVKATPTMTVDRRPDHVVRKETRVVLDVRLTAPGQTVTGDVKVTGAPGDALVETLSDGEARFKLPVFKQAGKVTLKVVYLGSSDNERVVKTVTFRVLEHR